MSNTGKTTNINKIIEWIIETYNCPNTLEYTGDNALGVLKVGNLTIGINGAGDNPDEIHKLELLKNEEYPDIILCCCRTKGYTRKYILKHFNREKGWLRVFINLERYAEPQRAEQDQRIQEDVKGWILGLPKK